MMLQVITWTRTPNGLAELSPSVKDIIGVKPEEAMVMKFPADQFCPPDFVVKLKRTYEKEQNKEGETTWKLLSHPLHRTTGGKLPVAVLLVFVRENGRWVKTVGHLFVLVPTWYARLPACCQAVVRRFALLLLGEAT